MFVMTRLSKLFTEFFESEKAGALYLLSVLFFPLVIQQQYRWWLYSILEYTYRQSFYYPLDQRRADGNLFPAHRPFQKKEIYIGELSEIKNALPRLAAASGRCIGSYRHLPVVQLWLCCSKRRHLLWQQILLLRSVFFHYWANGCRLRQNIPLTLAVIGWPVCHHRDRCVLHNINFILFTGIAIGIFVAMLIMNRLKIRNLIPYLLGGVAMWYCMFTFRYPCYHRRSAHCFRHSFRQRQ